SVVKKLEDEEPKNQKDYIVKKKIENVSLDWNSINFKKKNYSFYKKIPSQNISQPKNLLDSIEKEFTKKIEIWSEKKVKEIIEREFSNFIKKS
ncbi:MAG: hypothetical protein VX976_02550, partial [Pseudomonadota bacterium]|nr:hypothetical protein [Pseudomonadota bacterium]